jgi:hypothetical protein
MIMLASWFAVGLRELWRAGLHATAVSPRNVRTGPMMVACQWNCRKVSIFARGVPARGVIGETASAAGIPHKE